MRGKFESQLYPNIFTDAVHTAYQLQGFKLQLLVHKAAPAWATAGGTGVRALTETVLYSTGCSPHARKVLTSFCLSCNRLQRSDRWQEEASLAWSKSTHPKASAVGPSRCSSQSPEKVKEMLCKFKVQLKIICARDPAVLYHFGTSSNTLDARG